MMKQESNRRLVIAAIGAWLLLCALIVGWWVFRSGGNKEPEIVKSPPMRGEDAIAAMPAIRLDAEGKLDPETEKKMREMAHAHTAALLDEYFALPEGEARKQYLDRKIDEQESMRKMVEGLATTQPATQPADGAPRRIVVRTGQSPQAQKDFSETVPAEVQAKLAEYVRDMNARRAERGLPPGGGIMRVIRSAN